MSLILASGSPRRRELMANITKDFEIQVSGAEENVPEGLTPAETVEALAKLKGDSVFELRPDDTVVSADTVVCIDGGLLGKPRTPEEAFHMLRLLSGRTHEVYTGVYIVNKEKSVCFSERTEVTFHPLSDDDIRHYIATGEPADKAGAYGIQGYGSLLVKGIVGDYFNVMGFPVSRVARALRDFGITLWH